MKFNEKSELMYHNFGKSYLLVLFLSKKEGNL